MEWILIFVVLFPNATLALCVGVLAVFLLLLVLALSESKESR